MKFIAKSLPICKNAHEDSEKKNQHLRIASADETIAIISKLSTFISFAYNVSFILLSLPECVYLGLSK